jgi:hypothetical protein
MSNYFVIRQSDKKIVNVVVWDGVSPWRPDEGHYVELAVGSVRMGWQKVDGEWIAPVVEEELNS